MRFYMYSVVFNGLQIARNVSACERKFWVPNLMNLIAPKAPGDKVFSNGSSFLPPLPFPLKKENFEETPKSEVTNVFLLG